MKKFLLMLVFGFVMLFGAVDINRASKEELMSLKGIGEATADKIIEYRKESPFKSIEEIKNVKGVGEKKFEAIKGDIKVGDKNK